VEQMFAGFAPDREPAGSKGVGGETALDGLANRDILGLNALAYGDARKIALSRGL
jgi:hypothetical protein